jgi:CheY-like chemotaxis protein
MSMQHQIGSIMLIDDNEIDQRLCKRLIDRSGFVGEFIGFLSAEEALEYLRDSDLPAVDAILLDVNMPRMDGFEFLEAATHELGDRFAKIVIMMLTTSLDPRDQERARRLSVVNEFCHKPLEMKYLEKLADNLRDKAS